MTLPALGVIGLTFLCVLLVGGILFLIMLVKPDLRHWLCETLASYRGPPKEDKSDRYYKSSSRRHGTEALEDMYTSRVPPAMEVRPHSFHEEQKQSYAMHYSQGHPSGYNQGQIQAYPGNKPTHHNHPNSRPHSTGNPHVSYPQQNRSHSGSRKSTSSREHLMYPTSSGTSSPPDSAIGTMENKGIHGILKHSGNDTRRNSQGARSSKAKSVGYDEEIHTIEIS